MKKKKLICVYFSDECYIYLDMFLSDFFSLCRNSTTCFVEVHDIIINIDNIIYVEQLYLDEEEYNV